MLRLPGPEGHNKMFLPFHHINLVTVFTVSTQQPGMEHSLFIKEYSIETHIFKSAQVKGNALQLHTSHQWEKNIYLHPVRSVHCLCLLTYDCQDRLDVDDRPQTHAVLLQVFELMCFFPVCEISWAVRQDHKGPSMKSCRHAIGISNNSFPDLDPRRPKQGGGWWWGFSTSGSQFRSV